MQELPIGLRPARGFIPDSDSFGPHPPGFQDVDPGPTAGARDYRANPSSTQTTVEGLQASASRDQPADGGTYTPPMPDATIQSYDLKDQLQGYDSMGSSAPLPPFRPEEETT